MSILQIQAGKHALAHIREHGLSPDDIKAVFGASGAAKWLAICGLDRAIFGSWLSQSQHPIAVLGTSVGAMKLAAAVQQDCQTRLAEFASRYVEQRYDGKPTAAAVEQQTDAVIAAALGADGDQQVLRNDRYQFHCGAVHVSGPLAAADQRTQARGMAGLAASALRGKKSLSRRLTRVIFSSSAAMAGHPDCRSADIAFPIASQDGMDTLNVPLDATNVRSALLASGAIPVYLNAVHLQQPADTVVVSRNHHNDQGRRSDQMLVLRDGGLLDYHPIPWNLSDNRHGLVLYPHFYSRLTECWFDKFYRWRRVSADRLENVILVSPSPEFVRSLPGGCIPDRRDFIRFQDRDELRMQRWREAIARSEELGAAWMEIAERGAWADVVTPIR